MRRGVRGAVAVVASLLAAAAAGEPGRPPEPALPAPQAVVAERDAEALERGDARRAELLLDLALVRHAEAQALEAEERRAQGEAASRPGADPAGAAPALTTPRADARRAEAVRLAERALEEAEDSPAFARAPEALLVAGLDADRIGRGREALRWLGRLVRRHAASPLAAEAWAAIGEHHLQAGDVTRARPALEAAAASSRAELRAWADARLVELALGVRDADGALSALRRGLGAGSPAAVGAIDRLAAAPERLGWSAGALGALAGLHELSGAARRAAAVRARAAGAAPLRPPSLTVGGQPFRWRAVDDDASLEAPVVARLAAYAENAGAEALGAGDLQAAERLLERAEAEAPRWWRPRLLRARALAALGRPQEALAEAERVLDLERGQSDALQLAVGLRERRGG